MTSYFLFRKCALICGQKRLEKLQVFKPPVCLKMAAVCVSKQKYTYIVIHMLNSINPKYGKSKISAQYMSYCKQCSGTVIGYNYDN